METNPTTTSTNYAPPAPKGMFGTGVPASVAFAVGLLLLLLPLSEIKCGTQQVAVKSGLAYAMGKDWKPATGGFGSNEISDKATNATKPEKGNTQYFILGAIGLAAIGLFLSLGKPGLSGGGLITGLLAAGSMIGLMLDEKKNFAQSIKTKAMDKATDGIEGLGLDKLGNDVKLTLGFTPWFYIAVLAFVVAAIFSYMRMKSKPN